MHTRTEADIAGGFPLCRQHLDRAGWQRFCAALACLPANGEIAPALAAAGLPAAGMPPWLGDLARLEKAKHDLASSGQDLTLPMAGLAVNPALALLEVSWTGLADILAGADTAGNVPGPGTERLLLWAGPEGGRVRCRPARDEDLLVLKMVLEEIDPVEVAAEAGLPVAALDGAVARAVRQGLLLAPASRIRRPEGAFPGAGRLAESFASAQVFTLQWHITQVCDLRCRHCYDRSEREPLSLAQGLAVLDDLRSFCRERQVQGQVSFSGGNPLLSPHFFELYQAAVDRGLAVAILGNPISRERLTRLVAIRKPEFFQVSLEGLAEHNDYIRGQGYFARVLDFLDLLRETGVYSMVMLTLTRANQAQVLPLAELLRHRADRFVFNRLAMVGEGSLLESVPVPDYRQFLEAYLAAARNNPIMGLKDNFFNILMEEQGEPLPGGCAGFGCGAAFNFVALLPDGEVHACRKFPSPIGNISTASLAEIHDGSAARRYRGGVAACRDCRLAPVCGGCLAVSHGFGLDVFRDRDPYCFYDRK